MCNGGSNITVSPSYCRCMVNNSVLIILPCNDAGTRCLGGQDQTACNEIYSGVLCSQCHSPNGYVATGKAGNCNKCYDKFKLIIYTVLLLSATITYQIVMVVVTYKENKKSTVSISLRKERRRMNALSSFIKNC